MRKRLLLATAVTATLVASVGVSVASAGELTGTGQTTPPGSYAVPSSICAFSGLNDNPSEAFPENGRTQSFGQLVSKLGPLGGVPGTACNPNGGGIGG